MTKRILSMALSLALLLSCVSGITLFTAAEELPTPLAQWDANSGTFVNETFCPGWGGEPWTNPPVEQIPDTDEYGVKLTGDWQGGWFGGTFFDAAKADTAYTMVIEYYIDTAWYPTECHQMFRYALDTDIGGSFNDLFTDKHQLVSKQSGLIFCHFTAEEVAALSGADHRFHVYGCEGGKNVVYLQSMKLIESKYVYGADAACTYFETATVSACDYYPDIAMVPAYNMSTLVDPYEPHFIYVQMAGKPLAASRTENKWLYIKLQAAEGHENDTVSINAYEVSAGGGDSFWSGEQGIAEPQIPMVNGEGALFLEASFNNTLNNRSSLRFTTDQFAKIARIEVYDVASYCNEANATEEMKAKFHKVMADNLFNVTQDGYQAPSLDAPGATGCIACATCGAVLAESSEIPPLSTYGKLDFSDGVTKLQSVKEFLPYGSTNITPVAIPGVDGAYGIRIDNHDHGFRFRLGAFGDYTVDDLDNGLELAVSVEYYLPAGFGGDGRLSFDAGIGAGNFLGLYVAYSGVTWDCVATNPSTSFAKQQLNVATFKVGKNVSYVTGPGVLGESFSEPLEVNTYDFAKALLSGNDVIVRLWKNNDVPMYIKSITIYNAKDIAQRETVESEIDYVDFETVFTESPVYYPQYTQKGYADGLVAGEVTEIMYEDGTYVAYSYIAVTRALNTSGEERPVVVRFTFKEDCDITSFEWAYQAFHFDGTNPAGVWDYVTTEVTGPVAEILLDYTVFENQLNGRGSIRLPNGTAEGHVLAADSIAKIEVHAVEDKSDIETAIFEAKNAAQYKSPATVAVLNEALDAATEVAADVWATKTDVDEAIAAIKEAVDGLIDCTHENGTEKVGFVEETCLADGYTGDIACVDCGFVAEGNEGTVIPKHVTRLINVKENSCAEPGYSGDVWCDQCQVIAKEGEVGYELPHTWDEGVITKPATLKERGEFTRTCTACGMTMKTYFDYVFTGELGDVDGNNRIDSTDARLVLQYAVGKIQANTIAIELADVNGDSGVDSTDARLILQYAVGKIQAFPAA